MNQENVVLLLKTYKLNTNFLKLIPQKYLFLTSQVKFNLLLSVLFYEKLIQTFFQKYFSLNSWLIALTNLPQTDV